jgi:hypothetical protein
MSDEDEARVAAAMADLCRDLAHLPPLPRGIFLLRLAAALVQEAAYGAGLGNVTRLVSISAGLGKLADEAGWAGGRPAPPRG